MAPSDPDSLYTDPATGVFRNRLGLTDRDALEDAERRFSFARRLELYERPAAATFDFAHLRAIHRHLFQDLYDWAGEVRTVNITKGSSTFHQASVIDMAVGYTFEKLHNGPLLTDPSMSEDEFAAQAGELLADLNYIHPFREGNGRTQRVFLDDVAARSGRELSWRNVTAEQNIDASITAHGSGSPAAFIDMLRQVQLPPSDGVRIPTAGMYLVTAATCGALTTRGTRCKRRGACPFHGNS